MSANFPRVKVWAATETVTNTDLNAEFDNILNNLGPAGMSGYSVNISQMQVQTDPGNQGTESLATTTAGEIERIRFVLSQIIGKTFWYDDPSASLEDIFSELAVTQPHNRINSGRARTASSQAIYLVPDGTATTVRVKGATTNLVYTIQNTQYSIITDTAKTGLPTAPSTNNTCLVNDTGLAAGLETKFVGEFGTDIIVDAMGSEIVGLIGKYAGFKVGAEYFLAYVASATKLTQVRRGYFFDSADAPLPRVTLSDNATITLMKAVWIFVKADLSLDASSSLPRVSQVQPTGAVSGDYWFDITNDLWKKYDGVTFNDATATYAGVTLSNTTGCIAARSNDFYKVSSDLNTLSPVLTSNTEVRARNRDGKIYVYGSQVDSAPDVLRWDIATDLDSGLVEAADTLYYLYVSEDGKSILSDLCPMDRRGDLLGLYHPFQTWRCVGQVWNNLSSNFENVLDYNNEAETNYVVVASVATNALTARVQAPPHLQFAIRNGTEATGTSELASVLPGLAMTVSSGSTLGTIDATESCLFLSGIITAGRFECAFSSIFYPKNCLKTSTAEGGAGGADLPGGFYSNATRTSVPVRPLAAIISTQATAGTWATAPTRIALMPTKVAYTVTFLATETVTFPQGVRNAAADGCGGGGGGGIGGSGVDAANTGGGGASGGAGSPLQQAEFDIPDNAAVTITIGAGGASATNGADSSITPTAMGGATNTTILFPGGAKGANGAGQVAGALVSALGTAIRDGNSAWPSGAGGAGGGVTGGSAGSAAATEVSMLGGVNVTGAAAGATANAGSGSGGGGGSSNFGAGGAGGPSATANGNTGQVGVAAAAGRYGAGGGGGSGGTEAGSRPGGAGGAGQQGIIRIRLST